MTVSWRCHHGKDGVDKSSAVQAVFPHLHPKESGSSGGSPVRGKSVMIIKLEAFGKGVQSVLGRVVQDGNVDVVGSLTWLERD